jgi:hypothetical protein
MNRLLAWAAFLSIAISTPLSKLTTAQDASRDKSWSSTRQQSDPNGAVNPTRTTETHSESNGRTVEATTMQAVGPDGRYVPYSQTEKESVRVDANTIRTVERTYGTGPDGQKVLVQQTQEESQSLPGGEQKVARTTSSPDANGKLQVVRRELEDSRQVSTGVRETNTTVYSANGNGGMSAAVQVHERETQASDGSVQFSKSTQLADGAGHWNVSEVRQGTIKPEGGQASRKEEDILRPDADGKLAVVERKVSKQSSAAGETRATNETYSTNVPGQAGNEGLQLVQRESTVQRNASGRASTVRQVEGANPGNPGDGLRVTQQAIDIVHPDGRGSAEQKSTVATFGPDGQGHTALVDIGNTSNPGVVRVDTQTAPKAK